MSYVEKTINVENIVYKDIDKKIILSKDNKYFSSYVLVGDKWIMIRKSTSYNQCYIALFPKQKNKMHKR